MMDWVKVYNEDRDFMLPELDILERRIGRKNIKIIEIGCGIGLLSRELYDQGFQNYLCIDKSANAINRAIELSEGREISYNQCDVENYNLIKIGGFDVAIANLVIPFFKNKKQQ